MPGAAGTHEVASSRLVSGRTVMGCGVITSLILGSGVRRGNLHVAFTHKYKMINIMHNTQYS